MGLWYSLSFDYRYKIIPELMLAEQFQGHFHGKLVVLSQNPEQKDRHPEPPLQTTGKHINLCF